MHWLWRNSLEKLHITVWILRSLLSLLFLFLLDETDIHLFVGGKFQKTVKGIKLPRVLHYCFVVILLCWSCLHDSDVVEFSDLVPVSFLCSVFLTSRGVQYLFALSRCSIIFIRFLLWIWKVRGFSCSIGLQKKSKILSQFMPLFCDLFYAANWTWDCSVE